MREVVSLGFSACSYSCEDWSANTAALIYAP